MSIYDGLMRSNRVSPESILNKAEHVLNNMWSILDKKETKAVFHTQNEYIMVMIAGAERLAVMGENEQAEYIMCSIYNKLLKIESFILAQEIARITINDENSYQALLRGIMIGVFSYERDMENGKGISTLTKASGCSIDSLKRKAGLGYWSVVFRRVELSIKGNFVNLAFWVFIVLLLN